MNVPVQTLIVDDSPRSRAGLRALLATTPYVAVVAEAGNGCEAIEMVEQLRPDVVLMDIRMPGLDGLAATRAIKKQWPATRVILLTMYNRYRQEAQAAGAEAFLTKGCSLEELLGVLLSDAAYDC